MLGWSMRKVGGTPSEIGPDRANLRASARFDLGPFARGGGAVVTDLEGRIRTHSADNRTTVFEFYDSHVGLCCSVAKRALLFGISAPTVLDCVARYRSMSGGWFAIWFANLSLFRSPRQSGPPQGLALHPLLTQIGRPENRPEARHDGRAFRVGTELQIAPDVYAVKARRRWTWPRSQNPL